VDWEDLASFEGGGVDWRRLCGGAGGSFRSIYGLGEVLSKAAPWPVSGTGLLGASCRGECHGQSRFLVGGARGAEPGSKVSVMIKGPPQEGQG
jgi:hypothetical protein